MSTDFSPLDVVELDYGLRLVPRLQFALSFRRADRSVKAVDEWSLKEALKVFLRNSVKVSVADSDLVLQREREPQKKKREEPVASGLLFIWDIEGLLRQESWWWDEDKVPEEAVERGKQFVVEKLQGVELHVSGLKLRCEVFAEDRDDFEAVKRSWEAICGPGKRGFYSKNAIERLDTLTLSDVPSRWFAEPRVSSKASVLVTHTIFSKFGMIRNLEVNGVDAGNSVRQEEILFPTSLQCQIWVQYETFSSFFLAMKAFCGRSMQKDGTSLKANYKLTLDKDGFFLDKNIRKRKFEKEKVQLVCHQQLLHEARKAEIAIRNAEFERRQQLVHEARKAETAINNAEFKQIDTVKLEGERSSRVSDQKQAEEEKLERREEAMHFAQEKSRRKFQRVGVEPQKRGSQVDERHVTNMSNAVGSEDAVRRNKKQDYAEAEPNLHKNEHRLQRSEERTTKVSQDLNRLEEDTTFDDHELTDVVTDRWVLESTVTEASLAMSSMLEQAALKVSMMQSHKERRHDDHGKVPDTCYPFSSTNKSSVKRLCSKIVGNNWDFVLE